MPAIDVIPCSRHDEAGNDNRRLRECLAFVRGYLGGPHMAAAAHAVLFTAAGCVARLHDHKGTLYIVIREPPDALLVHAFRTAWKLIGGELEENVEVVFIRNFLPISQASRYTIGPDGPMPPKTTGQQMQWD